MYKDNIVILFNNDTKDVLATFEPNDTNINIEDFILNQIIYNEKFKYLSRDDVSFTFISKQKFEEINNNKETDIEWFINPITNEFDFDICKRNYESSRNKTFIGNECGRTYSIEQIVHMYHEDYINVNLKNIIKYGIISARFISIKNLKIRPRISHRAWKYFDKDPYLKDTYDDKLKLGRSIMKIGTYYPFIVAPMSKDNDELYVFEGNHRIMSLKLLAMEGEIDEDYKVMCLVLPTDFYTWQETYQNKKLDIPVKYRYILDDVYGLDIFTNKELMDKVLKQIDRNNEKLLDNYTVESTATRISQIFRSIHTYPLFLRDLIYVSNNQVCPSEVINNENKFKEWLEK